MFEVVFSGGDIPLFSYLPGNKRITGTIDNTGIANIIADAWSLDLEAFTRMYFNDAQAAFAGKGASVEVNTEAGEMVVKKNDVVIQIPEHRNYVYLNDEKIILDSVIVNLNGIYYVPVFVLDMIN